MRAHHARKTGAVFPAICLLLPLSHSRCPLAFDLKSVKESCVAEFVTVNVHVVDEVSSKTCFSQWNIRHVVQLVLDDAEGHSKIPDVDVEEVLE